MVSNTPFSAWPSDFMKAYKKQEIYDQYDLSAIQHSLIENMVNWTGLAECQGSPLHTIDTHGMDPKHREDVEKNAKRLCNICPVIDDCYLHAMAFPEISGIWGGMTAQERKEARGGRRAGRPKATAKPREPIRRCEWGSCENPVHCRGRYCAGHYYQYRRYGEDGMGPLKEYRSDRNRRVAS